MNIDPEKTIERIEEQSRLPEAEITPIPIVGMRTRGSVRIGFSGFQSLNADSGQMKGVIEEVEAAVDKRRIGNREDIGIVYVDGDGDVREVEIDEDYRL
jgi:hypothetical protein